MNQAGGRRVHALDCYESGDHSFHTLGRRSKCVERDAVVYAVLGENKV